MVTWSHDYSHMVGRAIEKRRVELE